MERPRRYDGRRSRRRRTCGDDPQGARVLAALGLCRPLYGGARRHSGCRSRRSSSGRRRPLPTVVRCMASPIGKLYVAPSPGASAGALRSVHHGDANGTVPHVTRPRPPSRSAGKKRAVTRRRVRPTITRMVMMTDLTRHVIGAPLDRRRIHERLHCLTAALSTRPVPSEER